MSRKDAYKLAAPVYDWTIEPFLAPIRKKTAALLAAITEPGDEMRLLEVACGTGSQARRLARPGRRLVALDRSVAMLSRAGEKRAGPDGAFHPVAGDGAALPFAADQFDAVVVQLALHEMPGPVRAAVMTEMIRVARGGAAILAADFVPTAGVTASNLLLTAVEFAAGRSHFRNGRLFLKEGGIEALLAGFGLKIMERWLFFGGNIGLVLARKPQP